MIGGEIAKEGLVTAAAKSTAEWIEHKLGINVEKFTEHVAVEVIAKLIVTTVLGLAVVFASRGIWRAIYRTFRATTIRKTASTSFVIVRCPIANDIDNAIGNEIGTRLETAFRAFAGKANTRPFHVMTFPLALSGDDGTKAYDAAIETAKRWLERTNGNILIWGKRVKGDSIGVIRLIGKDRRTGVIDVRRVDFDKRATDFDQALANAIAYEAAQLTQVTLTEPEQVHLDLLREVLDKLKRLAASDAPALSNKWRERMAAEHWRLTEEIVRRTSDVEECKNLESQARLEIAALDPVKQRQRFAETALRIGTLARKRNWVDPDPDDLQEARVFLDKACDIFEAIPDFSRAAEAALERTQIWRQQRVFLKLQEAQNNVHLKEARRLTELTNDKRLVARLAAESCHALSMDAVAEMCGFDKLGPSGAFEFVDRVSRHLDNSELADLAVPLDEALFFRGDVLASLEYWRATPQIVEAILNSRSYWTLDERNYLNARIASLAESVAPRLSHVGGNQAGAPFEDIRDRFAARVLDLLELRYAAVRRYIDFRALEALADSNVDRLEREPKTLQALRVCAGAEAARFPQLQLKAKRNLIVTLNNRARELDLLEAAEEALCRSRELEEEEDNGNNFGDRYIYAYAYWQAARLTPRNDGATRASRSMKAHALAVIALGLANEKGNRHYMSAVADLLGFIENDFPELAARIAPDPSSAN